MRSFSVLSMDKLSNTFRDSSNYLPKSMVKFVQLVMTQLKIATILLTC